MKRLRVRWALTLVVAVAIALGVCGASSLAARNGRDTARVHSTLTPKQRHDLLASLQPIVYYAQQEEWSPIRAETFIRDAHPETLVERNATQKWVPLAGPLPTSRGSCGAKYCYRLNLTRCSLQEGVVCYLKDRTRVTNWSKGYVYGRLLDVPPAAELPRGFTEKPRYLARFWFFYYFDDWRGAGGRVWQVHEGDWESVSFGLPSDRHKGPIFAAYSQHCSGDVAPWSSITKRQDRPVVYVALGSHANYFDQRPHATYPFTCLHHYTDSTKAGRAARWLKSVERYGGISDKTGVSATSPVFGPPGSAYRPMTLIDLDQMHPVWRAFPGLWSEGQWFWLGRSPHRHTSVSFGDGPATPNFGATSVENFWHEHND